MKPSLVKLAREAARKRATIDTDMHWITETAKASERRGRKDLYDAGYAKANAMISLSQAWTLIDQIFDRAELAGLAGEALETALFDAHHTIMGRAMVARYRDENRNHPSEKATNLEAIAQTLWDALEASEKEV